MSDIRKHIDAVQGLNEHIDSNYRQAVAWIAQNDLQSDDPAIVMAQPTIQMVATVWRIPAEQVAKAAISVRKGWI